MPDGGEMRQQRGVLVRCSLYVLFYYLQIYLCIFKAFQFLQSGYLIQLLWYPINNALL